MLACIHRGAAYGNVAICRDTISGRSQTSYPIFSCALYRRCLPTLRNWQPQHEGVEAGIYTLCAACADREVS